MALVNSATAVSCHVPHGSCVPGLFLGSHPSSLVCLVCLCIRIFFNPVGDSTVHPGLKITLIYSLEAHSNR
jgi:hypothetical protein